MRKLLILFGVFLCFGNAFAQISPLDRQLQNINQSTVTSGIIYDRSTPLADLCVYNMPADKPHNTADFRFFKQALFELHKASNYGKLVSLEQLKQKVSTYTEMNVIPIGIINTPFQVLNYNPESPNEGGLTFSNDKFVPIAGRPSFLSRSILLAAPLREVATGTNVTYMFSNNLIYILNLFKHSFNSASHSLFVLLSFLAEFNSLSKYGINSLPLSSEIASKSKVV